MPETFYFNDRARGIFCDGYMDRDGLPVGDTAVYVARSIVHGRGARDWTREQNAAWCATVSSSWLNAILESGRACHPLAVAQPPREAELV